MWSVEVGTDVLTNMKIKKVTMQSGLVGWQSRLHDCYEDYDTWEAYAESYGLHTRLGYKSPKSAWAANPMVQGSVDPKDFSRVKS